MAKKSSGKKSAHENGTGAGGVGASPMDLNLLEQITRLMRDNDLTTIEVRDGDKRVILKRGVETPALVAASQFAASQFGAQQFAAPAGTTGHPSSAASPGAATTSGGAAEIEAGLVAIKSPMVGTFYAAPSPDAKPFVAVGSEVDEETDVCIIEAMKVFNNIKAETKGSIAKVLVNNGQTVEFGQPLFLVKPA